MWEIGAAEQLAAWPTGRVSPSEWGSHQWSAEVDQWLGGSAGRNGHQGGWVEGWRTGNIILL